VIQESVAVSNRSIESGFTKCNMLLGYTEYPLPVSLLKAAYDLKLKTWCVIGLPNETPVLKSIAASRKSVVTPEQYETLCLSCINLFIDFFWRNFEGDPWAVLLKFIIHVDSPEFNSNRNSSNTEVFIIS